MIDLHNRIDATMPHDTATQLFVLGRRQVVSDGGTFTVLKRANEQQDASIILGTRTFRGENCPRGKMQLL